MSKGIIHKLQVRWKVPSIFPGIMDLESGKSRDYYLLDILYQKAEEILQVPLDIKHIFDVDIKNKTLITTILILDTFDYSVMEMERRALLVYEQFIDEVIAQAPNEAMATYDEEDDPEEWVGISEDHYCRYPEYWEKMVWEEIFPIYYNPKIKTYKIKKQPFEIEVSTLDSEFYGQLRLF